MHMSLLQKHFMAAVCNAKLDIPPTFRFTGPHQQTASCHGGCVGGRGCSKPRSTRAWIWEYKLQCIRIGLQYIAAAGVLQAECAACFLALVVA